MDTYKKTLNYNSHQSQLNTKKKEKKILTIFYTSFHSHRHITAKSNVTIRQGMNHPLPILINGIYNTKKVK